MVVTGGQRGAKPRRLSQGQQRHGQRPQQAAAAAAFPTSLHETVW